MIQINENIVVVVVVVIFVGRLIDMFILLDATLIVVICRVCTLIVCPWRVLAKLAEKMFGSNLKRQFTL